LGGAEVIAVDHNGPTHACLSLIDKLLIFGLGRAGETNSVAYGATCGCNNHIPPSRPLMVPVVMEVSVQAPIVAVVR